MAFCAPAIGSREDCESITASKYPLSKDSLSRNSKCTMRGEGKPADQWMKDKDNKLRKMFYREGGFADTEIAETNRQYAMAEKLRKSNRIQRRPAVDTSLIDKRWDTEIPASPRYKELLTEDRANEVCRRKSPLSPPPRISAVRLFFFHPRKATRDAAHDPSDVRPGAGRAPWPRDCPPLLHRVLVWAVQADWPVVQQLVQSHPLLHVYVVDVDAAKEVARHFQVQSMPTFCLYKGATPIVRFSGADPEKLSLVVETAMKVNLPFLSMAGTVQQPRRREY